MATTLVGGDETVLLVDDEEMIIEVGKAMLERLGYYSSGINLVVLDLVMPGMDGGVIFDRIREHVLLLL